MLIGKVGERHSNAFSVASMSFMYLEPVLEAIDHPTIGASDVTTLPEEVLEPMQALAESDVFRDLGFDRIGARTKTRLLLTVVGAVQKQETLLEFSRNYLVARSLGWPVDAAEETASNSSEAWDFKELNDFEVQRTWQRARRLSENPRVPAGHREFLRFYVALNDDEALPMRYEFRPYLRDVVRISRAPAVH